MKLALRYSILSATLLAASLFFYKLWAKFSVITVDLRLNVALLAFSYTLFIGSSVYAITLLFPGGAEPNKKFIDAIRILATLGIWTGFVAGLFWAIDSNHYSALTRPVFFADFMVILTSCFTLRRRIKNLSVVYFDIGLGFISSFAWFLATLK